MSAARGIRVLRPAPNVLAFYDGRDVPLPEAPTWLDWGVALGTCSYAIVSGGEALVYDTHCSLEHGRAIRAAVEAEGATRIRVALSHHHTDHIAGNGAFADCPILANTATARALRVERQGIEGGTPPVRPLVMPTKTFDSDLDLRVGGIAVALRSFNIHSHDGLVLWLPERQLLMAGDTLEDPVTFVSEPDGLRKHMAELERLAALPIARILPNHGDPERIGAGGYAPSLIAATKRYVQTLLDYRQDPAMQTRGLSETIRADVTSGALLYHAAYEAVHQGNLEAAVAQSDDFDRETHHAP